MSYLNLSLSGIEGRDRATFWCYHFVEQLYAEGLRHAVISPGSRSTPLAMSFDIHAGIDTQVVLDERSAAFTGLGIGKITGQPAALICTSGTAAANYFPAVIEAHHSSTPLLILTADRPPSQRFTGSSQTIDQLKLYGDYPVFFHETSEPVLESGDIKRLKYLAVQAMNYAASPGGPVHINFPFRKPLEPSGRLLSLLEKASQNQVSHRSADVKTETDTKSTNNGPGPVNEGGETGDHRTPPGYRSEEEFRLVKTLLPQTSHQLPAELVSKIEHASRILIIAGPAHVYDSASRNIIKLARMLNVPVAAEPASRLKAAAPPAIHGFDAFLRPAGIRDKLRPDLILRFGAEPVSKGLELLLQETDPSCHIYFTENNKPSNASLTTGIFCHADPASLILPELPARDSSYLEQWQETESVFLKKLKSELERHSVLSDPHVFYDLVPLIPAGRNIILSNSFPVRDFDVFGLPENPADRVIVNRGAAGIDGMTSTAAGCCIGSRRDSVLFTGDLAFIHDANALLQSDSLSCNLTIVVINNSGGTIFRMLPFEDTDRRFTRLFETPQKVSIAQLTQAHGAECVTVDQRINLKNRFQNITAKPGLHVLECITDASVSMQIRKALWQ